MGLTAVRGPARRGELTLREPLGLGDGFRAVEDLPRQRVSVGTRHDVREPLRQAPGRFDPGAVGAHGLEEPPLVLGARYVHLPRLAGSARSLDARDDALPQEQGRHVLGQAGAGGREVDAGTAGAAPGRHVDAPVRRPEVPQEERLLGATQEERLLRHALLARALPEDAQLLQPGAHARGTPSVAVP